MKIGEHEELNYFGNLRPFLLGFQLQVGFLSPVNPFRDD